MSFQLLHAEQIEGVREESRRLIRRLEVAVETDIRWMWEKKVAGSMRGCGLGQKTGLATDVLKLGV